MSTDTAIPLTKDDISAMRQATCVLVRMSGTRTAEITLRKETERATRGPFGVDEKTLERLVTCASNGASAYFHLSTHKYNGSTFHTFASILRAGDRLTLSAVENGNGYLEAAECPHGKIDSGSFSRLYADELTASVTRTIDGRDKTIARNVLLAYSVCPDNSARAIRQPAARY